MKETKEKELFVCYSVPLMKFLLKNNVRFHLVGLHPETKNKFWVFIRNDELNSYLKIWNKPIN